MPRAVVGHLEDVDVAGAHAGRGQGSLHRSPGLAGVLHRRVGVHRHGRDAHGGAAEPAGGHRRAGHLHEGDPEPVGLRLRAEHDGGRAVADRADLQQVQRSLTVGDARTSSAVQAVR